MSASQRNKGKAGEREAAQLLSDLLGIPLKRALGQERDSGADINDIPGWVVEVKRHQRPHIAAWWGQAVSAALQAHKRPAVMYRANRKPWRVVVPLAWAGEDWHRQVAYTAEVSLEGFAYLVREGEP